MGVKKTERELSISLLPHSCLPKQSFTGLSPLKLHLVPRYTIIFSHRDILSMSMSFPHTAETATGSVSHAFFLYLSLLSSSLSLSLSISCSIILVQTIHHLPPFISDDAFDKHPYNSSLTQLLWLIIQLANILIDGLIGTVLASERSDLSSA